MSSDKPIIFISCGQFTQEEKALGKSIQELIDRHGVFQGYFAENQSSLEGVTRNIFAQLESCFGLVCVMHERGLVSVPHGEPIMRGSVWIEQEIAIAAFLAEVLRRPTKIRVYMRKEIQREGVRDKILANPKEFESDEDILNDIPVIIGDWSLQYQRQKQVVSESLIQRLIQELGENEQVLLRDLSDFRPCEQRRFEELRTTDDFDQFAPQLRTEVNAAYSDVAEYEYHRIALQNMITPHDRSEYISWYLRPSKERASKSVRCAINALREVLRSSSESDEA